MTALVNISIMSCWNSAVVLIVPFSMCRFIVLKSLGLPKEENKSFTEIQKSTVSQRIVIFIASDKIV